MKQTPESPSGSPVAIPTEASDLGNDSAVPGANVKEALDALLAGGGGVVLSVFGRIGAIAAAIGDYVSSQVNNDSGVAGATVKDALDNLQAAIPPPAAVSSVFGRIGAVVSALNDYVASQVGNDSGVAGATVKDALDALQAAIPGVPVSSVFGRVGAVVAALNDYAASQVNNDSGVAGATVKDALDALQAAIPGVPVSSVFGRVGAVVAALNDYAASQVNNDSGVAGATVKDALDTLAASGGAVASVFGRVGAVVAAIGDYTTSQVTNSSLVSGATATDAFNTLDAVATQSAKGLMSAADKLKLDSLYPVAKLDNTNAWDALYLFAGDLNDSSGNGNNLALGTGVLKYGPFSSQYNSAGISGIRLGIGGATLISALAALRYTGDMTLSTVIAMLPPTAFDDAAITGSILMGCGANGETEAANTIYAVSTNLTTMAPRWYSEHGAGIDDIYDIPALIPWYQPIHLCFTRESNVLRTYVNGSLVDTSAALTAPTGGSTSSVCLGGSPAAFISAAFACSCFALKGSALNAAAVLTDSKRIWGVT